MKVGEKREVRDVVRAFLKEQVGTDLFENAGLDVNQIAVDLAEQIEESVELSPGLNEMAEDVNELAIRKGWWKGAMVSGRFMPDLGRVKAKVPEKLALIHSEISEALAEARSGRYETYYTEHVEGGKTLLKPEGFGIEIMDGIIRSIDLLRALRFSPEKLYHEKHTFNATRPYRHGRKKF